MDQHEINHLSIEEKKARFRQATVMHRLLEETHRKIVRVVREPAGFTFVLIYGPTGAGKSKMIETIVGQVTKTLQVPTAIRSLPHTPVLVIEADQPDRSVFDRGDYYDIALTLMGEQTSPGLLHMNLHGNGESVKRRPLRGKAAESNDLPELKKTTKDAMFRHGVQVVIIDEAHHMLSGGNGSTLQEQLEWLKSLSSTTQIIHVLVGTYDLLNFGQLNGQIGRRCYPVHFPRYLLQREADCLEFQSALVSLLEQVPLHCDVKTLVETYWVYFYEGCIGAVGVLKDWLMRAVSTALDEGQDTLTLDCLQDHMLPTGILRQMALDASEGEQKLGNTESNREHLWRILQGGELIAPVPPLPPRGTSASEPEVASDTLPGDQAKLSATSQAEEPPTVPVKKTRTRKKPKENPPDETAEASAIQTEAGEAQVTETPKRRRKKTTETIAANAEMEGKAPSESGQETPAIDPPKRRRKKTEDPVAENAGTAVNEPSGMDGEASSVQVDTATAVSTPKRTRRVGEPKPKRYPVGEQETEQSA